MVFLFLTSPKRIWGYLFLFNGTSYEKVLEATIKDNTVYAITENSLKYHPIDVTFSVYSNWNSAAGNYTQIDSKTTLVLSNNNTVYYGNVGSLSSIPQSFTKIKDLKLRFPNYCCRPNQSIRVYTYRNFAKTIDIAERS